MNKYQFLPHKDYKEYSVEEMKERAISFYEDLKRRRTVRDFSSRNVPREIIENCILAAGTAPNGANKQPWHFAVVESADIKKQLRDAAEDEEHEFYTDVLLKTGWTTSSSLTLMNTSPFWKKLPI